MDVVLEIFTAASTSTAAGLPALQTRLKKVINKVDIEDVLRCCLDSVLLSTTKDDVATRIIKLFSFPGIMNEVSVLHATLEHLFRRSKAADKTVRYRSCQCIHAIIDCLDGEDIDEGICMSAIKTLLPRLNDKIAVVRVWAIQAISLLSVFDEDDMITSSIMRLMESDSNKDIRIAAIESVFMDKKSLASVVERTKDVHVDVRIAAYRILQKKIKITHLRAGFRAGIVQYGLNDRDEGVRRAAKELLLTWLEKLDHDVPRLLSLMGLERYELEAEMLAYFLLEECEAEGAQRGLKKAVWETAADWSQGVGGISPADVLWTQLRCDFATKRFAPATSADLVDYLIPNSLKVCELIDDANTPALKNSVQQQLLLRYLLRLTAFFDVNDVTSCQQLTSVCVGFIVDLDTPDVLMESVLNSWAKGANLAAAEMQAVVISLVQDILHSNAHKDSSMEGAAEPGEEELRADQSHIRAMQLYTWMMQQAAGGRPIETSDAYSAIIPVVRNALAQPICELRVLAARCLGLLCLSSESICEDNREILLQVAGTDAEILDIRSQALQAVIDISAVYCDKYKSDRSLPALLLRILETCDEPMMLRQAAEGSAKLLFAGSVSEPRLFAQLTKMFFQPSLVPGALEEEGENLQNETFLGSPAHLQQLLSIFFQSFFIAGNGREEIALEATAELVADISTMIRNDEVEETSLQKIVTHLLSLCDLIQSSRPHAQDEAAVIRKAFCAKLSAAVSREVLKLGAGRSDVALLKELVQVLCSIAPDDWVDDRTAAVMREVAEIIRSNSSSSLDRATDKLLDTYIQYCTAAVDEDASAEGASEADKAALYSLAPGLADFVNLLADERRPHRRAAAPPLSTAALRANKVPGGARMSQQKTAKTKKKRVEYEDSDEDESSSESDEEDSGGEDSEGEEGEENEQPRLSSSSKKLLEVTSHLQGALTL